MRRLAITLVCLFVTASPVMAGTPLFLLDTDEQTFALVHRVDPATGQLTPLGTLPHNVGTTVALAAATGDRLYAVSWDGPLLAIRPEPFKVTVIGNIGPNRIVGLGFANGKLYGSEEHTGRLLRINPHTAATTIVGTIRLADGFPVEIVGGDLAEFGDGTWYLWTNATGMLYTLDVTTAVATPVFPQGPNFGNRTGLALSYTDGTLFTSSAESEELLTTDPTSGAPTAAVGFCLDCPEPYDVAFGDLASPRCLDADDDGFFSGGRGCGWADCDDDDADVHPLARERCNGRDDDCDGRVDEEPFASYSCGDKNRCTVGDRCVAGVCRVGTPKQCDLPRLTDERCRPSDGACCGKLSSGFLRGLTICVP